jgi:PAS domain S-box-containing protein
MGTRVTSASEDTAKILVVDDHDENILALEGTLSRPGLEIWTARSGAEALRLVLKHDFAVILLDVLMPTMDGFETARLIGTREASRHTPVIFLTAAGSDVEMVYRGYAVGAVDYLVKPLNPEVVKAKVAVFVELYRKSQQLRRQEVALREVERERNEARLKERDALYEASFDAAPVGIAHMAADGRWLRVNPRFSQITGYPREEALGMRFQDVTHPDDLGEEVAGLRRLVAGEIETYRHEQRYIHRDGHVVWVDLTVSLIYDGEGRPKHFITVLEDITERHRDDDRQRLVANASQLFLRSLDCVPAIRDVATLAASTMCDWCLIGTAIPGDGDVPTYGVTIAHQNPALAGVAGQLGDHLLGSAHFCDLLANDHKQVAADLSHWAADAWSLDQPAQELLQQLGCGSVMIVPLSVRDHVLGQVVLVSTAPSRRFGAKDWATARDLAQRIALGVENSRLYERAQEAIRARDEFLSIASHELRTPLTPLQIHFQRLLRQPSDDLVALPERLHRTLERCDRQVRRLEALIDNLLDVSRISSGPLRLQLDQVDLADIVRDVAGRFAEELSAGGCALHIEGDDEVLGRWDRLRLEQVVTNILGNAIKYGNGHPIEIAVNETPEGARLRIRDYGIGIEGQDLSRIFRRFHRAVPSRSYGGLGLGLYITRQIVDAHHGRIEVESTVGQGSEFVVRLPREAPEGLESGPHRRPEQSGERMAHA